MEKQLAPARQQRSRETELRLLNATIRLLDEGGLDAAVIPRIAELADVAPASVYRRFADKTALLRAAFLHVLERSNDANRESMTLALQRTTLADSLRELARLLMAQYRAHPQLLRALVRFMDGDSDLAFVQAARASVQQNVETIVEALMQHRAEIRHSPKKAALHFTVVSMTCTIESFALDQQSLWHAGASMPDDDMAARTAHAALAYLVTPHQ